MRDDLSVNGSPFDQIPSQSFYKRLKKSLARLIYTKSRNYRNKEGYQDYYFALTSKRKPSGTSVMLRAKNEEQMIAMSIRSIYEVFDEIVFIDNGSTDNTSKIVHELKREIDSVNKIKIVSYPFEIARCGDEHKNTNENSIHSLVYFYNWCLSRLSLNYVVKWDADMYLKPAAVPLFKLLMKKLQEYEAHFEVPIQTVYIDQSGTPYEAVGEINIDNQIFPNRPYIRYIKGDYWESLYCDFYLPHVYLKSVDVYEIKDTRTNEFAHWTNTKFTTERKVREWENYQRVRNGELETGFSKLPEPLFY